VETKKRFKAGTKKEFSSKAEVGKKNHEVLHIIKRFCVITVLRSDTIMGGNIMEKP
jgi:hypothetical protein